MTQTIAMTQTRSRGARKPLALSQLSLCIGLAFGGSAGWAQDQTGPAASAGTLKAVVVSGSRVEQEIDSVTATITTIDAETISRENPTDLEELMKGEVGVSVRAQPNRASAVFLATGRAGNEGVNIRGLEGDQVRLQVDGVSLPATYSSGPYAAGRGEMIDPEGYKRVEILRGSSSAQHGSDGLAGAVTFVTKEPEDLLTLGKSTQTTLKTGYSSADDSFQLAPSFAFKSDGVKGLVLASFRRGHETENMGTNDSASVNRTTPNPADTRSRYLLAKLQMDPSRAHSIKLTAESIRKRGFTDILSFFGSSSAAAGLSDVEAKDHIDRDLLKVDYRYVPTRSWFDVLTASLYVQNSLNHQYGYEGRSSAPAGQWTWRTRDTEYGEDTVGGTLQLESNFGKDTPHRLVYGLDFSTSDVFSFKDGYNSAGAAFVPNKSFPDTDYRVLGAFLQDEVKFGSVSVTGGLRYDSFKLTPHADAYYTSQNAAPPTTLSDSELSPKLGAVWKLSPQMQLFGQYAHGFRAPKPNQVNGGVTNLTASSGPYTSIGNPNLKPETSDTVEFGVRGHMGASERNWYSVTAFHGRYKDFISSNVKVYDNPVNDPMDPDVFQSVNLNGVRISGFEVRGQWELSKGLTLTAAYAHAVGSEQGASGARTPLVTVDPDKLVLGVRYDHGMQWGVGGQLTAVKRKDRNPNAANYAPPGYATADLSAWYNFSKATRLTFGIGNLFDKKYVEWADVRDVSASSTALDAYTQPGRNFRISLSHSF